MCPAVAVCLNSNAEELYCTNDGFQSLRVWDDIIEFAPVLPTTTVLALSQLSTSSVRYLFSWILSTEQRRPRSHITPRVLHAPDFLSFDSGI